MESNTPPGTTPTGGVTYNGLLRFPKYYFLVEHDEVKTVISLPNLPALKEVEDICRAAIIDCDHAMLGPCLAIKPATLDDWVQWH